MDALLPGVKVIELAEFVFVPSAAAILADWGADVIKVEDPRRGDTLRGNLGVLQAAGFDTGDYAYLVEQTNRGKQSIGLDLHHPDGLAIFKRLVSQADVLLTSFLEPSRQRLGVTYDQLKSLNPRLIYARGHGQGQRGPASTLGGNDMTSFWARSGMGYVLREPGQALPYQRHAFGDFTSGMFLAGGVAAALYQRSVTGVGGLVDVSLLGSAIWMMAPDIISSNFTGKVPPHLSFGSVQGNPLTGLYETSDERHILLGMLKPDRYWARFCSAIGRPDLVDHPSFNTFAKRRRNEELTRIISQAFTEKPLDYWRRTLTEAGCVWTAVQSPLDVSEDPQVLANGYLPQHPTRPNARLASSPIQFNDGTLEIRSGAPELGQDTEDILLELGLSWPDITRLKDDAVIS
jgi:crotonobetainyl-CoA:carnitine CoA-transferase CaiB-like acyl-CoA transferase